MDRFMGIWDGVIDPFGMKAQNPTDEEAMNEEERKEKAAFCFVLLLLLLLLRLI